MLSCDITVGIPIYYGAKIFDVERCLDSLHTTCENINIKYKDKIVNFLIGIDNCPKKFILDKSVQKNIKEIENRILIFQEAIKKINNNFNVNYFITETNVRVSVMRNIMISKTQNSKFITFIDHDDTFHKDAFNIIFNQITKESNKYVKIFYFQCINTWTNAGPVFEHYGPWSLLYNTKYLLENNISFIPDIPLEDRFFRRETEIYLTKEEFLKVQANFYLHNKEGKSGLLPSDLLAMIRQELFKRACYESLKIKSYTMEKIGFYDDYYKEYVLFFDETKNINNFNFKLLNENNIIKKDQADNFTFLDGKKLNKYPKDNQYTFCKIFYDNKTEIYCRGYLYNNSFNNNINIEKINNFIEFLKYDSKDLVILLKFIDKYISLEEFNEILNTVNDKNAKLLLNNLIKKREQYLLQLINKKEYNELEEILNFQDKNIDLSFIDFDKINDIKIKNILNYYLFNIAYNAINKENLELLKNIITKYPEIVKLQNKNNNINLANLACRKQIISDTMQEKEFINKIKIDNNKIIAFLLQNYKEIFLIKDIYGKCALDFLLVDYKDELKFNNNIYNNENINKFFKQIINLNNIFKNDFYKIIPYLRFIFNNEINLKNNEEILEKIKKIKDEYIKNNLIGYNIISLYKNKRYDILTTILIETKDRADYNILPPNYIKYTTFSNIFDYKDENNSTILNYAKQDKELNNFLRKFLIATIWLNFMQFIKIDPVDQYNIFRTKQAIEILHDKNNNFEEYRIDFKKYLDEFFRKSKLLTSLKLTQELHDKINIQKNELNKKGRNKISKINKDNIHKVPNLNKVVDLFKNIDKILQSNDTEIKKVKNFLELIENNYSIIINTNK